MEKQRSRDTGTAEPDTAPEVRAAELIGRETAETIRVTGEKAAQGVRAATGRAIRKEKATEGPAPKGQTSTKKALTQYQAAQRKKEQIKERGRQVMGAHRDLPVATDTPAAEPATYAPTPQDRMRQKAAEDKRTQTAEAMRELSLPHTEEYRGGVPSHTDGPPTPPPKEYHAPRKETRKNFSLSENQSIHQSIKEKPRRAPGPKSRTSGGKVQAKPPQSSHRPIKAVKPSVLERARQRAQRDAQRKMLQRSTQKARRAADFTKRTMTAVVKAAASLISALVGLLGGGVLVALVCALGLAAALIASPFGIFFSNEPSPGAVPLNTAVAQIQMELSDTLESLQAGDYDGIDIQGDPPAWRDVVAVFSAKTAGADSGVDVAALTPDRVGRLRAVFWDMCAINYEVEEIPHPDSDPDANDGWTEYILHITITAKTAEDMRTAYTFTDYQNQAMAELLADPDTVDDLLTDLSISEAQARDLIHSLPADLSPERRAFVERACSLVGKVTYFWGGKSTAIGWDPAWGQLRLVTEDGHSASGTYRPYGLDCSGFVDWALRNAGLPSDGNWYISTNLTPVSWADALPGDIVLNADASHVGIVGGRDESGNLLIVHCSSGHNGTVITDASIFTVAGRLACFND